MKRLAIVGSRDFPKPELVKQFVERLQRDTVVVSGGARGVDSVAVEAARQRGLATEVFEADWDRLGKRAGIERNARMIDTVHGLVAFWDGKSRGTQHAIQCAKSRGLWLRVYVIDGHKDVPLDTLSKVKIPFGQYANMPFDQIPLSYLDWLSGQPWMEYGWLREALTRYLTHPTILRELDAEFRSTDEWGNQLDVTEVFVPSEQTSKHFNLGQPEFIDAEEETAEERRLQRRVCPPTTYRETFDGTYTVKKLARPYRATDTCGGRQKDPGGPIVVNYQVTPNRSTVGAWKRALRIISVFEHPRLNAKAFQRASDAVTPELKAAIPDRLLNALRDAYKSARARLLTHALYPSDQLTTWEEKARQHNRRLFCRVKSKISCRKKVGEEELVAV